MNSEKKETIKAPEAATIYIPAEGNGDYVEGCLNGKNFRVKTGVLAKVPRYIARIIEESGKARQMSEHMSALFVKPGGKKVG